LLPLPFAGLPLPALKLMMNLAALANSVVTGTGKFAAAGIA
jgi:hypothetical protein